MRTGCCFLRLQCRRKEKSKKTSQYNFFHRYGDLSPIKIQKSATLPMGRSLTLTNYINVMKNGLCCQRRSDWNLNSSLFFLVMMPLCRKRAFEVLAHKQLTFHD